MSTQPTAPVQLTNWTFTSPALALPVDLAIHLSGLNQIGVSAVENRVIERLTRDPAVHTIKRLRAFAKDLKHFPRYRRNAWYQKYHDAARAVATGTANSFEQDLVHGLDAEIAISRIVVPTSQVLFHGRGDYRIEATPYHSYVSTSLNPAVARYHALKRASGQPGARATIYVLTLTKDLPAIWGHYGKSAEWELLLPRNQNVYRSAFHRGNSFDVVEADIG